MGPNQHCCAGASVFSFIEKVLSMKTFSSFFQNDFLYFFDLSCLFDDTWPLTSVFLATFSRCKEDNEDRRRHNMTSLVINYNNKTSYKENNIQQTLWWCLDQLPLDVGGQMDRWGDMIYCITDNSRWSSLFSPPSHASDNWFPKLEEFREVRQKKWKTFTIQNTQFLFCKNLRRTL